jgi:hypothetical protein
MFFDVFVQLVLHLIMQWVKDGHELKLGGIHVNFIIHFFKIIFPSILLGVVVVSDLSMK